MEKSKKINKTLFIILCVILNATPILIGPQTFRIRFLIMGLIVFFGGIYLLKRNPFENKKVGVFLIFVPVPLLFYAALIYSFFDDNGFRGTPLVFILVLSTFLALIFYKKSTKTILYFGIIFTISIGIMAYYLNNYYNYAFEEKNVISGKELPELEIKNEEGAIIDLKKMKGKTIVLDIWNSSCGICIKKFPEFEKLKNDFSNDKSIAFYTLNIPLERDDKEPFEYIKKYTNPYSFEKLYAGKKVAKQLNVETVPKVMIIDKNGKIGYIGYFITDKASFYNNVYTLIEEIKNK